ncbi:MAG: GAK system CofD-like protein [Desulfovibrionaceae bacterium]|nr:GAK system CofD-like protein [Desulfovibrionaceae bacterium]
MPEYPPATEFLPALGPRVVFFTGGTALRCLSRTIIKYTHNTVHLVTPFDSGGSSAALRLAFDMPAVGDVRNRLLALADAAVVPQVVLDICNGRLPVEGERATLLQKLYALASSKDPAWAGVPRVFGEVLRLHLRYFLENMPDNFDPREASVGNLILAGGYLHYRAQLGPVLSLMSRLLRVRGAVLPIVSDSLHLAAELEDGSVVVGQHRITGRGGVRLSAPVRRLFLTAQRPGDVPAVGDDPVPCTSCVTPLAATYLRAADCICYPMGSFYTSVTANLLPEGVGRAVADAVCSKVYIPNSGLDPEQGTLSVADRVRVLLETLRRDAGENVPASRLLQTVLLDSVHGVYTGGIDAEGIKAQGVAIRDCPLVEAEVPRRHDAELTARALLEYAHPQ